MIKWLKRLGAKGVLKGLDLAVPYLSEEIKKQQEMIAKLKPDDLALWIVEKVKGAIRTKYGITNG